ncbi:unnamed protein product [Vicia faba]|uniref:AB hydrolase-1 domain-containing protein n=1 Tax=Vicia faba TaxID=3906 RepID=A0AAV1AYY5_VICFA|nr:unnamed protein product [Vicia faba]
MEGIEHRTVEVNGIKMHIAEKGKEGPVVLFLHGFPELWYSWRHQIAALGSLGYRAVAPDLRGYGDTEAPASFSLWLMIGVLSLVGISVCFALRESKLIFQEPGKTEAEFAKSPELVMKAMLTGRSGKPLIIPKEGFLAFPEAIRTRPLPSWLSQQDIDYYASKFEKTGFTGALNYYRNFNLNWELTAAWTGAQIKVPVKFITVVLLGELICSNELEIPLLCFSLHDQVLISTQWSKIYRYHHAI